MAVKIRLRRVGKVHVPYYRIVVTDSRAKRDGRFIEQIGKYHPKEDPSYIEVDSERAQYWLGVGAQPSDPVRAILSKTGDWQKFKGEPAPQPLLVPESKRNRDEVFNEALKESGVEPKDAATTPKKTKKKSDSKKDDRGASDDAQPKAEAESASNDSGESAAGESAAAEAKTAESDATAGSEAGDDTSTS